MAPVKLLAWRGNDKKLSKKQATQVSKIVNKTKKYKMTFGGIASATYGLASGAWTEAITIGGTQGLNRIVKGNESYQRQGDTIMMKHYKMTMNFSSNYLVFQAPVANLNSIPIRVRIVVARLFGLYSNTPTDYFVDTTPNSNWIVEKGTVLYDKRFLMQRSLDVKTLSLSIPCKTKKVPYTLVQYNDANPVGVEKNDIRIFYYAEFAAGNTVTLDYCENLGYYDKY